MSRGMAIKWLRKLSAMQIQPIAFRAREMGLPLVKETRRLVLVVAAEDNIYFD